MKRLVINSSSITPNLNNNQTEIIFQRHCDYDREKGALKPESVDYQKQVILSFISNLDETFDLENLKNTYFLFTSSNAIFKEKLKRCLETTEIAMKYIKEYLKAKNISLNHIINLNEKANYNNKIHEDKKLSEPLMFSDKTGYLNFLLEKHNGMNKDFWIDFEEDLSKEKRLEFNSEGPDEIVNRVDSYIKGLQKYANYFHEKMPNSRLIIWCGTHYDLISPLSKQKILNLEKSEVVNVDYCGGISLLIDEENNITANINNVNYSFDFQENSLHPRHF